MGIAISHNKTSTTKVFFENLDGLRFVSFFAVFICHSFVTMDDAVAKHPFIVALKSVTHFGHWGVEFFFVLSGFLITYLLLMEKENFEKISIFKFYLRRILKIWPLYFFCVLFGFVIFPELKKIFGQLPSETANPLYYFAMICNYDMMLHGKPDAGILAQLWSIAIEEQFYLFWPIFIHFCISKWRSFFIISMLICCVFLTIFFKLSLLHTIHSAIPIIIGALLALLSFYKNIFFNTLLKIPTFGIIIIYSLIPFFIYIESSCINNYFYLSVLAKTIVSVLFACIIFEQNYSAHSFYKMKNNTLFSKLGEYTYGLYCLHSIGIFVAIYGLQFVGIKQTSVFIAMATFIFSLALAIVLAMFSNKYFESYFLGLKSKIQFISKK
jgi:peptidoglycan/LPS O-acetylase OafA/YrhL